MKLTARQLLSKIAYNPALQNERLALRRIFDVHTGWRKPADETIGCLTDKVTMWLIEWMAKLIDWLTYTLTA